jgi:hypothetical protein
VGPLTDTPPLRSYADDVLADAEEAFELLRALGGSPHLILHHRLVTEAATALVDGLAPYGGFDRALVILGAALHDAGKTRVPEEMHGPGHEHEAAGRALLEAHGHPVLARFCVSHARTDDPDLPLDDTLVALADKLWKGKRIASLETHAITLLACHRGLDFWDVFPDVDTLFEQIAAEGPRRLARSREPTAASTEENSFSGW